MVPRFFTSSSLLIPTPRSRSLRTFLSVSTSMRISRLLAVPEPVAEGSLSASKRILSSASLALEMSSRRKMSLLEYSEWMMMFIRRFTSALNSNFSPLRSSGGGAAAASVAALQSGGHESAVLSNTSS